MIYKTTYAVTPVGPLTIAEGDGFITCVGFSSGDGGEERETPLIRETYRQLLEYFEGRRKSFELPVKLGGTPFQASVWEALQAIPYGETRSYGEIAVAVGRPRASRAVGMANNKNPVAMIVPCHRVIGADGRLVGYGGGLDKKRFLLELEQKYK